MFGLVLDVFHHPLWPDLGAVDVALRIRRDALGCAGAGRLLDRIGNERRHRAVAWRCRLRMPRFQPSWFLETDSNSESAT